MGIHFGTILNLNSKFPGEIREMNSFTPLDYLELPKEEIFFLGERLYGSVPCTAGH